jgi:hypothetical protein
MRFITSLKDSLQSTWGSVQTHAAYVVTVIKAKINDPVFRLSVKTTLVDTLTHLPDNLLQGVRGFLQILHAPSAIIRAMESQRIRQASMASLRDNMSYALQLIALTNVIRLLPFVSEEQQQNILWTMLIPLRTRLFVNNMMHATNIAKTFSEENPNNKNFEPCEDGAIAQASADIESLFRYVSELGFAAFIDRYIPYVGSSVSFLLAALANAQYMIELKLSTVGMSSRRRGEIFVNNAMYSLGFSLSLLLAASYITTELKKIPGLKTDYLDAVVLTLLTQLFSMVAFLQHGPFTKKEKGKDLLSRDYFLINHSVMNKIISETLDLVLPRLEDINYRERQVNNIKKLIQFVKIPAVFFTDRNLYFMDRWSEVSALKLSLIFFEKEILRGLKPIDDAKGQMKRLPEWFVRRLTSMPGVLAYIAYMLRDLAITPNQMELLLNLLDNPELNQKILKIKYLLKDFNPTEEVNSQIESKPLLTANGIVIHDDVLDVSRSSLSETENGEFVNTEQTLILDGKTTIQLHEDGSERFRMWHPSQVEKADGQFEETLPPTSRSVDELNSDTIPDFYSAAQPTVVEPEAKEEVVDATEWRFVHAEESVPQSSHRVSSLRARSLFPINVAANVASSLHQASQSDSPTFSSVR